MAERIEHYQHDGLTFDVVDSGPLDGEPVVLLHGFPERASSWSSVSRLLNDAGYRTLAPDQRGYSPGARPTARSAYTADKLAGDVKALIDLAGGSAHVVGHDWGASAAWSTTGMFPEAVRTLTAVSVPHPAAFQRSMLRSPQGLKSWYMFMFQLPVVPERLATTPPLQRWMRAGGMTDADLERFQRDIVDAGALRTAINWYRGAPLTRPSTGAGRRSRVPTTLVWGDRDLYVGHWAVDRCQEYVEAPFALVRLAGVSHWIPTQAPQALAEAILTRVRS